MSRLLEATCSAGVVTCEGVPVPAAEILSEGVGSSAGFLILDGEKAYYVAKTSPDLKTTLEQVSSALGAIVSALSTIDAKPVGGSGSAPAPGAAGNITTINSAKTAVDTLKASMR